MRYQSATYLALTDVIGEAPGTSAKWGLIAQDGIYSAVAGTGISLNGNTISISSQLLSDISGKVTFVETTNPDTATENGTWYKVHTNSEDYALFAISVNAQQAQFRIKPTGTIGIRRRYLTSGGTFPAWGLFEQIGWKRSEIEDMIDTKIDTAIGGVINGEY